jgi:hypothetical protein
MKDAIVEEAGNLTFLIWEEVGASDVADEEGIAGKDSDRVFAKFEVGKNKRNTFKSVTGGFEWREENGAKLEGVAVG